ncbi:hypothetical protein RJ55_07362 [Drechmeria coniospora]|nr:hypothetical protein RJ55_07362 [Drechmeria coniospora]
MPLVASTAPASGSRQGQKIRATPLSDGGTETVAADSASLLSGPPVAYMCGDDGWLVVNHSKLENGSDWTVMEPLCVHHTITPSVTKSRMGKVGLFSMPVQPGNPLIRVDEA